MLIGGETGNNEAEEGPTLLQSLLQRKIEPQSNITCLLSVQDTNLALDQELDLTEENCLEYLSGYFFKRLLSFHSTNCQICSNFAQKFTNHAEVSMVSQIFLHFKRYDTDKATLYQCTDNFIHFCEICHSSS